MTAKSSYFSDLIDKHHQTPKVIFSVINSVLNPPVSFIQHPTNTLCDDFLRYFGEKVSNLRAQIQDTDYEIQTSMISVTTWTTFNLVSLQSVKDIIVKLKPSFSPCDIIHPRYLRQIIDTVGPELVSLLNKCLSS